MMLRRISFAVLVTLSMTPIWAQTVIEVGAGKSPEIRVSRKDFNRIAVFEGRVKTIKFKKGELDVNTDDTTGSAFIMPNVAGTISAYIVTNSGQAHLVYLVPSDVPAQTAILREPKIDTAKVDPKNANEPKAVSQRVDRASSFDTAIKRIIGAMARNERLADLTYKEINQEFQLWQGTRLWLMERYEGNTYGGEHYRIQNTSTATIRIDEREFFKPGVLAVSLELHQLAPQETTDLFIVREGGDGK